MTAPRDRFWLSRIEALARTGLPHQHRMMERAGRTTNFAAVRGNAEPRPSSPYDDSDAYKWLEACAYVLAIVPDSGLRAKADALVESVLAAQEPDGYLNTHVALHAPETKWANLATSHEMYNAGHLVEAGVAWAQRLGDRRLLGAASRFAELIEARYGEGGEPGIDGHPELELALLRLAEETGDARWTRLAERGLALRGARPSAFEREIRALPKPWPPGNADFFTTDEDGNDVYDGRYAQDHAPIEGQATIEGHAMRAAYLYAAAARLLRDAPDEGRKGALERLWTNLTERRMYVTGGIGSSAGNEGFTRDYDLPNRAAYAETCASCALVLWGDEMLRLTGDSVYADVVETALFNNVLAGISPEGDRYLYANPLESRGEHARAEWFACACCPSNAARTIARVGDWALHAYVQGARVHFPVAGEYRFGPLILTVEGDYPRSGAWSVTVRAEREARFDLGLRIPDWANDVEIDAPDELGEAEYRTGYAVFDRVWSGETTLKVEWPMPPTWIAAHPAVRDDAGRLALRVGPTVYAMVSGDAPVAPAHLQVDHEADVVAEGGELRVEALYEPADPVGLYAPYEPKDLQETTARYVPYRDWANGGPTEMLVWARKLEG